MHGKLLFAKAAYFLGKGQRLRRESDIGCGSICGISICSGERRQLFGMPLELSKCWRRWNANREEIFKRVSVRKNDFLPCRPCFQRFLSSLLAMVASGVQVLLFTLDEEMRGR
jgi:hypothetical protein